ncbi:LysR family transcriptional regulator [Pseudomonas sp. AP-1]|uniref:LysR family transcriptional regulator n=1 Tax=Pseudomonas sp. AP-1 TaxID=3231718 RepID=UPI0035B1FCAC
MTAPDLNLLITLEAVLAEGSVARAAKRLRLSPSAMSRALARLRETTGDPLLVRAGRGLVPTPRAIELRDRVSQLVSEAKSVLRPSKKLDLQRLERTFRLRTSEGFVECFGPELIARVADQAPHVRLCFMQKPDKDSKALREGAVDLETGVIETSTAPELYSQALFRDNYVGVVCLSHPLAQGVVTAERYAAGKHILVSRTGADRGPIDDALVSQGLSRNVVTMVAGFSTAVGLARVSDLIASVPARHTTSLREGMYSFPLPVPTEAFTLSLLWHPRFAADPAHQWLRTLLREVCLDMQTDPISASGVHSNS